MPYNNLISRGSGAALIPEEVSNEILKGLDNDSLVMDAFKTVRMSRKQTRLPILSALPQAYFVNGDTGLKQTTQVDWANKYLNAEELACIVPIPEAVLDDTDYDIWGEVKPLVTEAIARALDAAVLFGTNAPAAWPTAIVTAAAAAGNTVTRGTNAAATGGIVGDFSDLFGKLETDGFDADYLAAITTYKGRLRQARATTGEALEEVREQVTQTSVFGAPVMYPARGLWPTGSGAAEAIALERDQFILGIRQDITMKVLDQAVITDNVGAIIYNLAQQDMVALRVVFRAAWQNANTINYDQPTEASRYPAAVMVAPLMGTPTQVSGVAAESLSAAATAGFLGWSPEADRVPFTLLGGLVNKGTYANSTAYAAGDVVLYSGGYYRVKTGQSVASNNVTAPVLGSVWADAGSKRGTADVSSSTARKIQPNR